MGQQVELQHIPKNRMSSGVPGGVPLLLLCQEDSRRSRHSAVLRRSFDKRVRKRATVIAQEWNLFLFAGAAADSLPGCDPGLVPGNLTGFELRDDPVCNGKSLLLLQRPSGHGEALVMTLYRMV